MRKSRWPQKRMGVTVVVLLICIAVLVSLYATAKGAKTDTLQVGGRTFSLEVADTPQARTLGLGKRASMPVNRGMVFVFGQSATQCFWMKDMHFPLDIIWLDANKKIVHIAPSLSPATYPKTFCPSAPAKYVIELNAGTAARTDMRDGQTLNF